MKNFLHQKLVSLQTVKNLKINTECQDQLLGSYDLKNNKIIVNRDDIVYIIKNNIPTTAKIYNNPIVIILESPHKSEFKSSTPIGPAQGSTGRLFLHPKKGFISKIANSKLYSVLTTKTNCDIILINAIQFQCSNGLKLSKRKNKRNRDDNFYSIYTNGGNIDLKTRLEAIQPFAVINLCTKGFINLQLLVHDDLKNLKNYTYGSHPSTFNFKYSMIF